MPFRLKLSFSNKLKTLANEILQNPPKISKQKLDQMRYGITDLINDLRMPRSNEESTATATELYNEIADFYFRANGLWSAKNKGVPRILQKNDPELCKEYCESFEALFVRGNQEKVIKLTEKILNPHGGFLFEGVKLDAPKDWRKPF